jgi:hypothetical protein
MRSENRSDAGVQRLPSWARTFGGVMIRVAFALLLVLWLAWAVLLAATFRAFGLAKNNSDYVATVLTYALDPIVLILWWRSVRRGSPCAIQVLLLVVAVLAIAWPFI